MFSILFLNFLSYVANCIMMLFSMIIGTLMKILQGTWAFRDHDDVFTENQSFRSLILQFAKSGLESGDDRRVPFSLPPLLVRFRFKRVSCLPYYR